MQLKKRTNLKSLIKVSDFAQIVQELIDASLVVLNEGIQRHHVRLLGVRRLIREVLKHLCDLNPKSAFRATLTRKGVNTPESEFVVGVSREHHQQACKPVVSQWQG